VAVPGEKILDSIASGMRPLPPDVAERGCLVIPGDCPFLTPEAMEDFVSEVRRRPADFYYGYLTKQDSEKAYPGLRHTYAKLLEGTFCGTGLIKMTPQVVEQAKAVMNAAIAARKSPLRITGILGWPFIFKLIFRRLSVRDCETRISELMHCRVAAVQTRHACAGFNVDSPDQLQAARALVGEN
jgi:CTP:molybdopterin cytidylyltransferase MocA